MSVQAEQITNYCIFEYFYCDAGNWSTGGILLLVGEASKTAVSTIMKTLESPDLFVAEQIGIPSLCLKHFESCGSTGPNDLDHAYHSFDGLRAATKDEIASIPVFGSLDELVGRFAATQGYWNVQLSPNAS